MIALFATSAFPNMPATAVSVEVLSATNTDTATGTGMQVMNLVGLDSSWDEITQSVTLTGKTAVVAAIPMTRVYRAYGTRCGTYGGSNNGVITVRTLASTAFMYVATGQGQSMTSHICVSNGYDAYISDVHISVPSARPVDLKFWQRQHADTATTPSPVRIVQIFDGVGGDVDYNYSDSLLRFQPKTDLWFTGTATSGANGSASIEYLIVKKSLTAQ